MTAVFVLTAAVLPCRFVYTSQLKLRNPEKHDEFVNLDQNDEKLRTPSPERREYSGDAQYPRALKRSISDTTKTQLGNDAAEKLKKKEEWFQRLQAEWWSKMAREATSTHRQAEGVDFKLVDVQPVFL